ncbi:MAG: GNAT family N-acetyltransferase [Alphaproteobacteria bacterium]|nr:GNAT family N-acetyltransferase [Alphaproteobacteria bacterium]
MSAAKLEKPNLEYKKSYIEAIKEFHEEDRYTYIKIEDLEKNFEKFLEKINDEKKELQKSYPDWVDSVPETVLWLVKENDFIGTLDIRHRLNWHLEKWGGHVNFTIRASMRRKGFGKKLLQKAVPHLAYYGIDQALITVNPKDDAANRIVQFCGGSLNDTLPETDKFPERNRYWLDCT